MKKIISGLMMLILLLLLQAVETKPFYRVAFKMQIPIDWTEHYEKIDGGHSTTFTHGNETLVIKEFWDNSDAKATADYYYENIGSNPGIELYNRKTSARFNYLSNNFDYTDKINDIIKYGTTITMNLSKYMFVIIMETTDREKLETEFLPMEKSFVVPELENKFGLMNSGLPFGIGSPKEHVHYFLGEPEENSADLETYPSIGLNVYYNSQNLVNKIIAKSYSDHPGYTGYIFGAKIGDSVFLCEDKWGQPTSIDKLYETLHYHLWYKGDVIIECEVWAKDYTDKNWGEVNAGHVKEISFFEW